MLVYKVIHDRVSLINLNFSNKIMIVVRLGIALCKMTHVCVLLIHIYISYSRGKNKITFNLIRINMINW